MANGSLMRVRTSSWILRSAARHVAELVEGERLLAVDLALVGRGWTSTHDAVGARRNGRHRHRPDQPALAGGVRGIDDDGQVGQVVEQRHGRQVERVAGVGLEGADAALAQDDVRTGPTK